MAEKKRGLGRTLETLLSGSAPSAVITDDLVDKKDDLALKFLPIEKLAPGQYQPRRDIDQDALNALADSIKSQGVLQPIVARQLGSGSYEIIAGERRWRASQVAGLTEVPVIVKSLTDEEALAIGLIENIQREDLNPLEEALALQRLASEFSLTHQQIADSVGRSRTGVTNLLRILTLNTDVKTLLEHGDIELGHAKVLLALQGQKQSDTAKIIVSKGFSVRETEKYIHQLQNPTPKASKTTEAIDPDIRSLQQRLTQQLGAQVNIQMQTKGKGKLVITYNSLDELDGILAHIS